jgi:hypothetical protein
MSRLTPAAGIGGKIVCKFADLLVGCPRSNRSLLNLCVIRRFQKAVFCAIWAGRLTG